MWSRGHEPTDTAVILQLRLVLLCSNGVDIAMKAIVSSKSYLIPQARHACMLSYQHLCMYEREESKETTTKRKKKEERRKKKEKKEEKSVVPPPMIIYMWHTKIKIKC